MNVKEIQRDLRLVSNKEKALVLQVFFKTRKGEYGEGDEFIGVTVPIQRIIAKKYINISIKEISKLIKSNIHEERLTAVILLTYKYEKAKKENNKKEMKKIYDFYLNNTKYINNWDLVDITAPKIIGDYLLSNKKERKILETLSNSTKKRNEWKWLWERRIAILATFTFIKNNEFTPTIKLAKKYLKEEHDLMHKSTGWMLREIGKRDEKILIDFLNKFCKKMPRTMLRYSIEKLDEKTRQYYLKLT